MNIIGDQIHTLMTKEFLGGDGSNCLYEHNSPYHKARYLLVWYKEHSIDLQVIYWFSNSSDINSIGHFGST